MLLQKLDLNKLPLYLNLAPIIEQTPDSILDLLRRYPKINIDKTKPLIRTVRSAGYSLESGNDKILESKDVKKKRRKKRSVVFDDERGVFITSHSHKRSRGQIDWEDDMEDMEMITKLMV